MNLVETFLDKFEKHPNTVLSDVTYQTDTNNTWNSLTPTLMRTNGSGVAFGDLQSNRWSSSYASVISNTNNPDDNYWVEASVFVPKTDLGSSITMLLSIDETTTSSTPISCVSITWQPYDVTSEINNNNHGWITEDYALNIGYNFADEFKLIDGLGIHTFRVELFGRTVIAKIDDLIVWSGTMTPDATALPLTKRFGFGVKTDAGQYDTDYFSVLQFRSGTFREPTQEIGKLPTFNEYSKLPEPSTYSNLNDMRAIRAGFDNTFAKKGYDQSTETDIGFSVNFMGNVYTKLNIHHNGYISFANDKIDLAIFYTSLPCDLNLRGQGTVKYGPGIVYGRKAFGITWNNVSYQNTQSRIDKRNTFQMVFVQRNDIGENCFDLEFNYGKIEWESCEADGGSLGLGGTTAWIGHRKDWVGNISVGGYDLTAPFNFSGNDKPGWYLDTNRETSLLSNNMRSIINGRYTHYFYNGFENDWLINFFFSAPHGFTNFNYGAKLGYFLEKGIDEYFTFTYPTFESRQLVDTDIVEINRKTISYDPPHQMTVPTMLGEFGSSEITVTDNVVYIKMVNSKNNFGTLMSYVTPNHINVTQVNDLRLPEKSDMYYYRKQDELMFVDFRVFLINGVLLNTPVYFHIQILPEDFTVSKWFIKDVIYDQHINSI